MKIGDEVYVHGYIDEIRQNTVIIRNDGGYFGTVPSEVVEQEGTLKNLKKPNKSDLISRQAAIDAVNGLIDRFEQILRDIRETNVDDSVCGMCEYDGAYIGQSGDWCNECPGFDKDDCFKLSDECRKRWGKSVDLPSAQLFTEEQIQTMQELESAQVEKAFELGKADRTTGHWIENAQEYYEMINKKGGGVDENTPYFTDDIACSECLAKFSVIDNETERFDFCPNCGSYNGGGEE